MSHQKTRPWVSGLPLLTINLMLAAVSCVRELPVVESTDDNTQRRDDQSAQPTKATDAPKGARDSAAGAAADGDDDSRAAGAGKVAAESAGAAGRSPAPSSRAGASGENTPPSGTAGAAGNVAAADGRSSGGDSAAAGSGDSAGSGGSSAPPPQPEPPAGGAPSNTGGAGASAPPAPTGELPPSGLDWTCLQVNDICSCANTQGSSSDSCTQPKSPCCWAILAQTVWTCQCVPESSEMCTNFPDRVPQAQKIPACPP